MLTENERWLLSFYRTSEISGALFFGGLAKSLRPGANQMDMSRHFAEEAMHAWYWTECLQQLDSEPLRLGDAYQDQYTAAVGLPANLMEVLAITQVFERRVIQQYAAHLRVPGLNPVIERTLRKIIRDEKWHLQWVSNALDAMADDYGKTHIEQTLARFLAADQEVYRATVREHRDRLSALSGSPVRGDKP